MCYVYAVYAVVWARRVIGLTSGLVHKGCLVSGGLWHFIFTSSNTSTVLLFPYYILI